jgi:hypothetical protein
MSNFSPFMIHQDKFWAQGEEHIQNKEDSLGPSCGEMMVFYIRVLEKKIATF